MQTQELQFRLQCILVHLPSLVPPARCTADLLFKYLIFIARNTTVQDSIGVITQTTSLPRTPRSPFHLGIPSSQVPSRPPRGNPLALAQTMPDSEYKLWSGGPYAPTITEVLYLEEKATFGGNAIGAILYGTPKIPHTHFRLSVPTICSVHPTRDHYCGVLSMCGRTVQPRLSQGGAYQVGTRILHCGHVRTCDRWNHDAARR